VNGRCDQVRDTIDAGFTKPLSATPPPITVKWSLAKSAAHLDQARQRQHPREADSQV